MRVIGMTAVKNEADRYLDASLSWQSRFCEDIFVYDDASTDESSSLARAHGCWVTHRHPSVPSFIEHEGRFRQGALEAMARVVRPEEGDWVFVFDADEFLVSEQPIRAEVEQSIDQAEEVGADAIGVKVAEIFAVDEQPLMRVDGCWGMIDQVRLYRWGTARTNAERRIADRPMACGSVPEGLVDVADKSLRLVHYGYLEEADRRAKYERYLGRAGHGEAHVRSILSHPSLVPLDTPAPVVWRGVC